MTELLVDTNVLLRLLAIDDPRHTVVKTAIEDALRGGHEPLLAPQIVTEAWVVLTRPLDVNGFGWEPDVAHAALSDSMKRLRMLPETSAVFDEWWRFFCTSGRGKRAHDARIAALMRVYGVRNILTFNAEDFRGMDGVVPIVPGTNLSALLSASIEREK